MLVQRKRQYQGNKKSMHISIKFLKLHAGFLNWIFNMIRRAALMYDYLIVGSGLYGSIFAREATKKGYKCLVIDKRDNVGGNIYTEKMEGINVHKYGAHIFHTNNQKVWDYITQYATFNRFTNSPVANYKG